MEVLIGATGTIGQSLLKHYSGRADVRALVHSDRSEQLAKKQEIGEVQKGDFKDPETLQRILQGAKKVFLLTPPAPDQGEDELRVLEAAKAAGVQRIVYISLQFVGRPPSIRLKAPHERAEAWLEQSGLSYAAIQPPAFIDNLLGQIALIRAGQLIYGGGGNAQIAHIDSRDVAAVAAAALKDQQFEGRVPITGPEAVTYAEIARRLSQHLGRTVAYVDPPASEWKTGLLSSGMSAWYANALVEGVAYYAQQEPFVQTAPIEKATGRSARPIDDFMRETIRPLLDGTVP